MIELPSAPTIWVPGSRRVSRIFPVPSGSAYQPEKHLFDVGGFSPKSISNLVLWLRADLGTNTTTGGAAVTSWADQSGNGNNAAQGTAANQPTYVTNSANGRPGVHFDGVNDFMAGAVGGAVTREPFSIYAISKMTAGQANQQGGIVDVTTVGGLTNTGDLLIQNSTNRDYRYASALDLQYALSSTAAVMNVTTVRITGVGAEEKELFEKSVSKGTQAVASVQGLVLTQYRVGRLFQDVFPFNGDVLEVACYSKQLSTTEIAQLTTYATGLYAV